MARQSFIHLALAVAVWGAVCMVGCSLSQPVVLEPVESAKEIDQQKVATEKEKEKEQAPKFDEQRAMQVAQTELSNLKEWSGDAQVQQVLSRARVTPLLLPEGAYLVHLWSPVRYIPEGLNEPDISESCTMKVAPTEKVFTSFCAKGDHVYQIDPQVKKFVDDTLRNSAELSEYTTLKNGFDGLTESFVVTVENEKDFYDIDIVPIAYPNTGYSFSINKKNGKILVVNITTYQLIPVSRK